MTTMALTAISASVAPAVVAAAVMSLAVAFAMMTAHHIRVIIQTSAQNEAT